MKLPVEIFRSILKWNEEWWLYCTNHETQKYRLIHLKKIKSIPSLVPAIYPDTNKGNIVYLPINSYKYYEIFVNIYDCYVSSFVTKTFFGFGILLHGQTGKKLEKYKCFYADKTFCTPTEI
jgi:hypothetical protein